MPDPQTSNVTEHLLGELFSELADRFSRGELVDLTDYQAKYPEHADRIQQLAPTIEAIARLGELPAGQLAADGASGQEPERLGDFRIMREIGRGGMGVVFEAEQLSLGRSVALKVLPFAAVLDPKAIQRFKNEARAAATLDHPHIVPIISVGNERGVYYYAMSLIEGLTVAEVISSLRHSVVEQAGTSERLSIATLLSSHGTQKADISSPEEATLDLRQPLGPAPPQSVSTWAEIQAAVSTHRSRFDASYFQSVAKLGAHAAEALDHAHQHGIVHRDIKPGNLMLDATGKLWVTDFGLARVESDPGMTATGDLLGTLRYMAPEQALAKRVVVDHRADVYALGVTLYELLTLRPAFDGPDRETLLRQIAFEEPKPLMHYNRAVPVDLQTIVLKAISKNPDDRYASAQEMAHDLRAFLDNEPIRAKPPRAMQRVTRWVGRHRYVTTSAAAILVLALIGLATSNALIVRERDAAREAETNEHAQRLVANAEKAEAEYQRDRAEGLRKEAERSRQETADAFQQALKTVDTYLTKVSEDTLLNQPGLQPLRKELLQLATDYYQSFVEQRKDSPQLQAELGSAYARLGDIAHESGSFEDAHRAHQQALKIRQAVAESDPKNSEHQHNLANSYIELGAVLGAKGSSEEGIAAIDRAASMLQDLVAQDDNLKFKQTLGLAYLHLGVLHDSVGHLDQAVEFDRKSLVVAQECASAAPQNLEYLTRLGISHNNLALTLNKHHEDADAAARTFQNAIAVLKEVVAKGPDRVDGQEQLATAHLNLGATYEELKKYEQSGREYENALQILKPLARKNPNVHQIQLLLAIVYVRYGTYQSNVLMNSEAAERLYREALLVEEDLARYNPDVVEFKIRIGNTCEQMGTLFQKTKRHEESENFFRRVTKLRQEVVKNYPKVAQYRVHLDVAYESLFLAHLSQLENREAFEVCKQRESNVKELVEGHPGVPRFEEMLADVYELHALQVVLGRAVGFLSDAHLDPILDDPIVLRRRALVIREDYFKKDPKSVTHQENLADALVRLGHDLKVPNEKKNAYERGIERWKALVDSKAGNRTHQLALANGYKHIGRHHERNGQNDIALRWIKQELQFRSKFPSDSTQRSWRLLAEMRAARIHYRDGDESELVACSTKVVELVNATAKERRSVVDWSTLGGALYYLNRLEEAKSALETAIKKSKRPEPTLTLKWWWLVMTLHKLNDTELARSHYEKLAKHLIALKDPVFQAKSLHAEAGAVLGIKAREQERKGTDPQ